MLTDEQGVVADLFAIVKQSTPAWHADALCKEAPPEVSWFSDNPKVFSEAQRVCSRCVALFECRSWAKWEGLTLKGVCAGGD